jgi:ubiquitin C-terminal hydrolase
VVVKKDKLFCVQLKSTFAAYYRRKRQKPAPRQQVPDEDELRNSPDKTDETLEGQDANLRLESIPEYPSACRVLAGVLHLAECHNKPYPRAAITHWLLADWKRRFTEFLRGKPDTTDVLAWIAAFTSFWWVWAIDSPDLSTPPDDSSAGEPTPDANHVAPPKKAKSKASARSGLPRAAARPAFPPDPRGTRRTLSEQDFALGSPFPIHNLGNTCYMAAVLQCLHNIAPLTRHFLDENFQLSSAQKYAVIYRSLQFSLNTREKWEVDQSILSFALLFQREMPAFQQHDPHEFLMLLLQRLQKDLGPPEQPNLINDMFYGVATTKCECSGCAMNKTTRLEEFGTLTVDVPEGEQPITVRECMNDLFTPATPEKANCSCGAPRTKQTTYHVFPRFLSLQFKATATKCCPVRPERELKLTGHSLNETGPNTEFLYRPVAFIRRVGKRNDLEHGHYVAHVRVWGPIWYECNDSCVKLWKWPESPDVWTFEPYMAFYEREEGP